MSGRTIVVVVSLAIAMITAREFLFITNDCCIPKVKRNPMLPSAAVLRIMIMLSLAWCSYFYATCSVVLDVLQSESTLIDTIKQFYGKSGEWKQTEIHCITFLHANDSEELNHIARNVHYSWQNGHDFCLWLIIVYNYEVGAQLQLKRKIHQSLYNATPFHVGRRSPRFNDYESHAEVQHLFDSKYKIVFAPLRERLISATVKKCDTLAAHLRSPQIRRTCRQVTTAVRAGISDETNNDGARDLNDISAKMKLYPKMLLIFYSLLHLTHRTKYTWVLDSDISLQHFDFAQFQKIVWHAFPNPLILAQPLIRGKTQSYPYLNRDYWLNQQSSAVRNILAVESKFIEIQAPLFNTGFLVWYMVSFVLPLTLDLDRLGADWGFDQIFCRAAEEFSIATNRISPRNKSQVDLAGHNSFSNEDVHWQHHMGQQRREDMLGEEKNQGQLSNVEEISRPVACAIIVANANFSLSVGHSDTKQTDRRIGAAAKKAANAEMMHVVATAYPQWVRDGHDKAMHPIVQQLPQPWSSSYIMCDIVDWFLAKPRANSPSVSQRFRFRISTQLHGGNTDTAQF